MTFRDDINSSKPYTFCIETKDKIIVLSAFERQSFIQWIRALDISRGYLNPLQVADISQNEILPDASNPLLEDNVQSIRAFLIENYCDSARLHLIRSGDGQHLYRVFQSLQRQIPPISLGWRALCRVLEHEVDVTLSKSIKSISHELPRLGQQSGDILSFMIDNKTKKTLTISEKQYLNFAILRMTTPMFTKWPFLSKSFVNSLFH